MSSDEPSIYTAPESDTSVASADSLMAAYVGPKNADYYAARFDSIENGQSVSWHWPAFFISSGWLLYRKMWLMALAYWIGLPVALTILEVVLAMVIDPAMASIVYFVLYVIATFVLVPMYANKLYYNHVKAKVDKVDASGVSYEQKAEELERKGGTSIIAYLLILIPVIGILAAIAIPAYNDYVNRAQMSEIQQPADVIDVSVVADYRKPGSPDQIS